MGGALQLLSGAVSKRVLRLMKVKLIRLQHWYGIQLYEILQISDPGDYHRSVQVALSIPPKKLNHNILDLLNKAIQSKI